MSIRPKQQRMIDFLRFCKDFNIPYWTDGVNVSEGWINIQCPFCHDHSNHLGYNPETGNLNCWRCGKHNLVVTLRVLTGLSGSKRAQKLIESYKQVSKYRASKNNALKSKNNKQVTYPPGTNKLTGLHKDYLASRGFNAERLEIEWELRGTLLNSYLDNVDYSYRIIAPFYEDNKVVSYQARAVSEQRIPKYLPCLQKYEVIPFKDIVYHHKNVGRRVICVEGITDVWKLGKNAVATCGIKVTKQQIRYLSLHFSFIGVCFDNEPDAQNEAKKLVSELCFRGVNCMNYQLPEGIKDPGELSYKQSKQFIKEVLYAEQSKE